VISDSLVIRGKDMALGASTSEIAWNIAARADHMWYQLITPEVCIPLMIAVS